ncbi:hypothetical protein NLI96_g6220 [Meripilus lineatus]|uniref:PARP catalytic domain-containing protein n=1 Tax=Meripilus lineatus TaxID=2056292 RepID=A0AAD5V213_9APHY|nr:hypothetical protein NLI96_g6220 [Physisporinus lineatus]
MPSRLVATSSKTEEAREMRTDDGTAQLVNADSGTVGKANSKTGWGRFGAGIYTSSTSSKSDDYSTSPDPRTSLKAMVLNKVVVGKGYKMTQDNTSLTAPPAGFDSVLAEKGTRLNHDELVVYVNEAIRPSYLVIYDEI